ncbi:MAG: glycosyltransferase [Oscillospiraceae bacterium]|nr:glycosyltransferase [Oscillospiraceae bacterium]MCL2278290.1 glycosyltransferase [Oscillospiraceae bacterium]
MNRIRKGLLESIFKYDHEIYFYLTGVKNAIESSNITDLSAGLRKDKERIRGYLDLIAPDEEHYANLGRHEKKLKMAMFTPLPPLMNGIADYIVDLLPELSQHFHIDFFIDDNYTPSFDINRRFKVQNHSEFPILHEEYDLIVYQVGNNPNHVYMVDYILKYPGIIELHDYRVDYLYRLLSPDIQEYAKANSISEVYPSHELFGYATNSNPVNKYLIEKSLGVIIHNNYAKKGLLKQSWYIPYKVINLSVNVPLKTESSEDLLSKLNIEKNELILATFGRVTAYKHIDIILRVVSHLRKIYDKKIRFIIVGNIDSDMVETINWLLSDLDLKDSVTITGHVELDTFYDYIQVSNICINLRSFYNGESSGAVARIMSCAKPCVVSNVGSFGELPSEACIKVTTDEDLLESDLIHKLGELIQNQKLREKISKNAFNYAMNELNPKKLALEMRDFIILSMDYEVHTKRVILDNLARFICYNAFIDIKWVFDYACKYLAKKWERKISRWRGQK